MMNQKPMKSLTPSQLKTMYENSAKKRGTGGHFFDKDTMKFFGDSMSNYTVTMDKKNRIYVLRRKKPNSKGLVSDHFFCADTFKESPSKSILLIGRK